MWIEIILMLYAIAGGAEVLGSPQSRGKSRSSGRTSVSSSEPVESVTPVPILRQINEILEDGSYRFGYEAGDGTFRIETRQPDGTVHGKYGFRDADGQIRVVDYSATNETGFDAQGEHIPKGPPPARAKPSEPDDFDYEDFTTRPSKPKTRTRPSVTTVRHRPTRPPTTPLPVLDDESQFNDESEPFFTHQLRTQQRTRPPLRLSPQVPVHDRPIVPEDELFLDPLTIVSPTAVQQANNGRVVAKPVTSKPRNRHRSKTTPHHLLNEHVPRPQTPASRIPETDNDPFQREPAPALFVPQQPHQNAGLFVDDGQRHFSHFSHTPDQFQTHRPPSNFRTTKPQRTRRPPPMNEFPPPRPTSMRPLANKNLQTTKAATRQKVTVPSNVHFQQQKDHFAPNFEDFQLITSSPKRPKPQAIHTPHNHHFATELKSPHDRFPDDENEENFPSQIDDPPSRLVVHHEPPPQFKQSHQPTFPLQQQRPGSVIDDFLASIGPHASHSHVLTQSSRKKIRPQVHPAEEVVFVGERPVQSQPTHFRQVQPMNDFRGMLAGTHGFVLEQRPTHHSQRSKFGPFVESAHLTQTVPGALDPIVHQLN